MAAAQGSRHHIGYVGNLGRHEIIPVPFNQAGIATPSHPIHGQNYTYGYTVLDPQGCNPTLNPAACAYTPDCNPNLNVTTGCGFMGLPNGTTMMANYEGGNMISAFPTSATPPNRSPTPPPASPRTTPCRSTSKNA